MECLDSRSPCLEDTVSASQEQAITSGMDEEIFEDYLEYVENELASGISEPTSVNCAKHHPKERTRITIWPKQRGLGALNWSTDELGVFENLGIVENEANMAYWNTMAGQNSLKWTSHTIVQRASKKWRWCSL